MIRLLLLCSLFFFSCKTAIDQTILHGSWKAAAFLENNQASELDLSHVQFDFHPNGTYAYHGTLQAEEAGRYYTVGKLLFTTDTTATSPLEKSVKIIKLTADSLYFQMNAGGVPQIFQLYKSK